MFMLFFVVSYDGVYDVTGVFYDVFHFLWRVYDVYGVLVM